MDPLRSTGPDGGGIEPEVSPAAEPVMVPTDKNNSDSVREAAPLRPPEEPPAPPPIAADPLNANANCNGQHHHRRRSQPRPTRRRSRSSVDSIPPTSIAASPPAPPVPIFIGLGDLDDLDFDPDHRTTLERRRQQTLLISILDLMIGLGLLTYHTDRIITFYRPTRSQLQLQPQSIDNTSPLVIILWTITFSIILLQLSTSASLLSCSYSTHCTDLAQSSRSTRRANFWIICAQLLMTLWIAKLTIYTASFQFGYEIGVFNIVVEDYTSIWFVLLFYLGLVVFKGVGIFFVRKYVREL